MSKPRLLLIINPRASTVKESDESAVSTILSATYDVEVVKTCRQHHAQEIVEGLSTEDYAVVVAYSGDGTINEIVNGLVGKDVALGIIPGGFSNVICRNLGLPLDAISAAEYLATRSRARCQLSLGQVILQRYPLRDATDERAGAPARCFVFGSGVGIDARALRAIENRPRLKHSAGLVAYFIASVWSYLVAAIGRSQVLVRCGRHETIAAQVIIQKMMPYAYVGKRPLHIADSVRPGSFSITSLRRAKLSLIPALIRRVLLGVSMVDVPGIVTLGDKEKCSVFVLDEPFVVHADGEVLGEAYAAHYSIAPETISVIAETL